MKEKQSLISASSLILANVMVALGVIFWGWSINQILILYWVESVIIGFFNVFKMLLAQGKATYRKLKIKTAQGKQTRATSAQFNLSTSTSNIFNFMRLSLISFFALHYSGFMYGHLFFLVFIISFNANLTKEFQMVAAFSGQSPYSNLPYLMALAGILKWQSLLPVGSLFVSHLISFVTNYLGKKEYLRANIMELMFQPYKRIVLMHLTLIFGLIVSLLLGGSVGLMLLFVTLKTILDLRAHFAEHKKK